MKSGRCDNKTMGYLLTNKSVGVRVYLSEIDINFSTALLMSPKLVLNVCLKAIPVLFFKNKIGWNEVSPE